MKFNIISIDDSLTQTPIAENVDIEVIKHLNRDFYDFIESGEERGQIANVGYVHLIKTLDGKSVYKEITNKFESLPFYSYAVALEEI